MPDSSTHHIVAIVLAAGGSSRMGKPKLLLPWNDHTMIEETVDQTLQGGYDEVVVVVGPERQQMQELLATRPIKVAFNLNYRSGMSSSIKAGASFIDVSATAFAIVLGDQPRIRAKTHSLVLAQFRKGKKGICVPTYDGQPGHPVIFAAEYRPRMFSLQGDNGAKSLIERNRDDVVELPLKSPEILPSINSQRDYEEQLSLA
jgi:molybdenum cofactor cytidylyltransferase